MQSTHQLYLAVNTCQLLLLVSVTRAEPGLSTETNTVIGSTPAVYLYYYKLHCIYVTGKFVTGNFILPKNV